MTTADRNSARDEDRAGMLSFADTVLLVIVLLLLWRFFTHEETSSELAATIALAAPVVMLLYGLVFLFKPSA